MLQECEFERVGGSQTLKSDVRIIAATNRDLPQAVRDGTIRADLYYRLHVFPIHLPPLRERLEDIPGLAQRFLAIAARRLGRDFEGIGREAIEPLQRYRWPGNVRELEHVIERAAVLTHGRILHLPPDWIGETPAVAAAGSSATRSAEQIAAPVTAFPEGLTLEEVERAYIETVLQKTHGRIAGPNGAAPLGHQPQHVEVSHGQARDSPPSVLHVGFRYIKRSALMSNRECAREISRNLRRVAIASSVTLSQGDYIRRLLVKDVSPLLNRS